MSTRATPARRLGVRLAVPLVALAAALTGALTGCTEQASHLTDVYERGAGDYVSGDGRVITLAADKRDAPVQFSGTLEHGGTFGSDDVAGRVVIVNFWYAACPPCREEAPDLEKLRAQFDAADEEVTMVGVNVSDDAGTAIGFEKKHGLGYPSIIDGADNAVQLAFADNQLPQNSVPTTLILDRQGRVAARISGLIQSPSVVSDIVATLLAEKA